MKGKNKKSDIKVSLENQKPAEISKESLEPHREVCYEILKDHGKPMHYKKITEEVLKKTKSVGLTPQNSMFARMATDNKGRFTKLGKGMFGLTEWKKEEVVQDAQ